MKKLIVSAVLGLLSGGLFAVDQADYTQWVTLTNSDSVSPLRVNSFAYHASNITNYWSDGCYPSKDKNYYVPSGRVLMTTTSSKGNSTFQGGQLAVAGEVLMRGGPGRLDLGSGAHLLDGGCVRFGMAQEMEVRGTIAVESSVDHPSQIYCSAKQNTSRGYLRVNATFTGAAESALTFVRAADHGMLPAPDSTYVLAQDAFASYGGTVIVGTNVELTVTNSLAVASIPGRLRIENDGRFLSYANGANVTVGTLEIADGAMMMWDLTTDGQVNEVVVTNALEFQDGAQLKVQFGEWHPKAGAQKYPLLRLTDAAVESDVTAEDFVLDFPSPPWRTLPDASEPQIVIDDDDGDVVVSVEWPDGVGSTDTLVLCGNDPCHYVDALADEDDVPLTVIKEGTGTWIIGPSSSFTGALKVNEGKVVVGNPNWEYYRWVIQATYNTTPYSESQSSALRVAGLKSLGLFDVEGNDRVFKLSDEGDWTQNTGYYQSLAYSTPIQAGHFRITSYTGDLRYFRGLNVQYSSESLATNLFGHSQWAAPNFWSNDLQKHPDCLNTNTWVAFTMRPLPGNPITSWDYVNDYYTQSYQMISNCTLEASLDCRNWVTLSTIDNPSKPTRGTWQGDGSVYEAGYDTHTGGMPISSGPNEPITFVLPQVSVAQGATLASNADAPLVLSDLLIDYEKGLGTITNFAFASTGTLRITNTSGRRRILFAADLSGVQNRTNLEGWTILIDGVDRTDRCVVTVTAEGIRIEPKGLMLLISSGGTYTPTYLTAPAKEATGAALHRLVRTTIMTIRPCIRPARMRQPASSATWAIRRSIPSSSIALAEPTARGRWHRSFTVS